MRGTRWTLEIASPTLQLSNFTNGPQVFPIDPTQRVLFQLECPECGKKYTNLSQHLNKMHRKVILITNTCMNHILKVSHFPQFPHLLDVSHVSLFRSNLWCATSAGRTSTSKANWNATKKMSTPSRSPKNRNSIYIRLCSKHHSRPPDILWSMLEFICCFPLTSEIYKVYPTLKAQFSPTGAQSLQSLCKLVAEDQKAAL